MNILFKLTLLFFCSILSLQGFTQSSLQQQNKYDDVVYFYNAAKIYGEILNIEDDTVEFEMTSGEVVIIHKGIIKKIIKNFGHNAKTILRFPEKKSNYVKEKFYKNKPYQFKEKGIYNNTYVDIMQGYYTDIYYFQRAGSLTYYQNWLVGIGIHHVTGMQHKRSFGTGMGLGFDSYAVGYGRNFLSVYGECRGYLLAKRISPYYSVGLGYGFSMHNKYSGITDSKGGLFFNPSLGYRFGGSDNTNFVMSLGYKLQVGTFVEEYDNNETLTQTTIFNRLSTTIGILF